MGYHGPGVVLGEDGAGVVRGAVEPVVAVLGLEDCGHAMGVVAGIVDLPHEVVGGQSDVDAVFDRRAVGIDGSIPEAGEGE